MRQGTRAGVLAGIVVVALALAGCGPDVGQYRGDKPGKDAGSALPPEPETAPSVGSAPPKSLEPREPVPEADSPAAPPPPAAVSQETRPPAEPLFVDWPQPQLVLAITGRQHGYIEPCGCTGLDRQKGGLARRQTFLKQLADERGWTVVPVDAGNQVRRFGRQAEIKFQVTVNGLKQMGYQAVGFGPDDLHLSIDELAATTAQIGDEPSLFVSANTAILDRELTPELRIVEAGGRRVGITTVLGDEAREKLRVDEVLTSSAEESLRAAWPKLQDADCDFYVLLAYATREETLALARAFPDFHIVVTTGGGEEPSLEPEAIPGSGARLVQVGAKGMYVAAVGLFDDHQTPWRYERIPLDARFADAPEMLELMSNYQQQLERLGWAGLGIQPIAHPSGRSYVGSEACGDCHEKAFAVWEKTPHAHATDSLVHPGERVQIPRHYDPECVSCHVTGWNPQRYIPYTSGYLSLEQTPRMLGNGCENCHGPGSAHVAVELGDVEADEEMRNMLRAEMRLPLAEAEKKCLECHDLDNSPDFHAPGAFEKYWREILHVGKD